MAKHPPARKRTTNAQTSKAPQRGGAKKKSSAKASEPPVSPQAQARQEAYLAAVRLYEVALESLQRRQFDKAAAGFQKVVDDYPEERELHERCRLYLQVCARELKPPPVPETLEERVYAATLALNSGSQDEALGYLELALEQDPDSDQVQYMLALARAAGGDAKKAVTHLLRAIELNPDNRFLARQESSFDLLREDEVIQAALKPPSASRDTGS